jgi:hypothetical protein
MTGGNGWHNGDFHGDSSTGLGSGLLHFSGFWNGAFLVTGEPLLEMQNDYLWDLAALLKLFLGCAAWRLRFHFGGASRCFGGFFKGGLSLDKNC